MGSIVGRQGATGVQIVPFVPLIPPLAIARQL
jgi:hypothetical protein